MTKLMNFGTRARIFKSVEETNDLNGNMKRTGETPTDCRKKACVEEDEQVDYSSEQFKDMLKDALKSMPEEYTALLFVVPEGRTDGNAKVFDEIWSRRVYPVILNVEIADWKIDIDYKSVRSNYIAPAYRVPNGTFFVTTLESGRLNRAEDRVNIQLDAAESIVRDWDEGCSKVSITRIFVRRD